MNLKKEILKEEEIYGSLFASDCHKVGIIGGCGLECWIYQEGNCEYHKEQLDILKTESGITNHNILYNGD